MKTNSFAVFVGLLLLVSCDYSDPGNPDGPYHVNLERDIGNISSIPLSYLGNKLEYVSLETDPDCMIRGISDVSVSDSFLFVSDNYRLLLFDRRGKFIKQIGSQGRGPGEYGRVYDFAVDDKSREVYVLTVRKLLVYDFNGQFKRDFGLGFPSSQFVLNESNELVLHPINLPKTTDSPYCWYIFNKNGKVKTKIPITLKRFNGFLAIQISPLYMYNGTLHFMEFGIDTLFSYKNNLKKPHVIFHYGNFKIPPDPTMDELFKTEGKFYISNVMETKKSLFIKIWYVFPYSTRSNCVFDKSTSEFTILKNNGFINDIDGGLSFWPQTIINDSLMVDFADAFDLIKSYKDKEPARMTAQSAQLENIIKNLTETSNPVIMILYP